MTEMTTNPARLAQLNEQLPAGVAQPDADSQDTEKGEPPRLEDQKPTRSKRPRFVTRFRAHLNENVSTNHADILMLTCCLVSGLVDSTIYNAYGTFVSMQTGISRFPRVPFPQSHPDPDVHFAYTNLATQAIPYSSASAVPRPFTALRTPNPTAGPNPLPPFPASFSAVGFSLTSRAILVPSGAALSLSPSFFNQPWYSFQAQSFKQGSWMGTWIQYAAISRGNLRFQSRCFRFSQQARLSEAGF